MNKKYKLRVKGIFAFIFFCLLVQPLLLARDLNRDIIVGQLLSKDKTIREKGKSELLSIAQKDLSSLEKYLNYKGWWTVRYYAVQVLSTIPGSESTKLLLKIIFQDTQDAVVSAAGYGLKGREKDINQSDLLRLLEMNNRVVLEAALGMLEKFTINQSILECLARRLEDKRWYIRGDVAQSLSKAKGVKIEIKTNLILSAIEKECENPTPEEKTKGEGMCIPLTKHIECLYRSAILNIGDSVVPFLKERIKKAKGRFRKSLIIMLGYLGEQSIYTDLVDIAMTDGDGWLRAWAARGLGEIAKDEAIPVLKKALKDAFCIRRYSDVLPPPSFEEWNLRYPVREGAFSALTKLGVKVESKGRGVYKIIE